MNKKCPRSILFTFSFIIVVICKQSIFRQHRLQEAVVREGASAFGQDRERVYTISHRSSYEVYTLEDAVVVKLMLRGGRSRSRDNSRRQQTGHGSANEHSGAPPWQ